MQFCIKFSTNTEKMQEGGKMDLQSRYDDLDNLIRNIDNAIDEVEDKKYMKDYIDDLNYIKYDLENELEEVAEKLEEEQKREEIQMNYEYERSVIQMYENEEDEDIPNLEKALELAEMLAEQERERKWGIQMGENKYSEIIKNYTFEQLVYERSILDKQKENLYIQDKELKEEFKRRLELNRGKNLNNKEEK